MVGSVVGVGVFGLPFVFSQTGYGAGLLVLLLLSSTMTGILFMYADVIAHTPGEHRFAGIIETYLGKRFGRIATMTLVFGFWGAMLAYLVAGGKLLSILFGLQGNVAETFFGLCIAALIGALSYRGLRFVARIEVWMLAGLIFLFSFIVLAAFPHADLSRLADGTWNNGLLALYGVVFFSLTGGISAIPEMRALLGKRDSLPYAVFIGMACITALYAVFTFSVIAATGTSTSEFAIDALVPLIGGSFRVIGVSLAVASILSIYMVGSVELQNSLRYDNRLSRVAAWALAIGVPVVLYLAGVRSFIGILGFIGAVFAGVNGILVVFTYERMRATKACREHVCLEVPRVVTAGLVLLYLSGIVVTLYSFI
ncbi:hypothetical protein A2501_03445 [Candidatus Uhrbacteria bacterium RIFOXYC12_FULL_57_11]|nr:MAG: hypothetical protein A2501_03445 [Candidatus Uhrbacteria bacterium RIFOXYC12_FULL_57_11]